LGSAPFPAAKASISTPMIVLCDFDHTISDAAWRDDLIAANDWPAYFKEAHRDEPIWPVVHVVNALWRGGHKVVILTARPEWYRAKSLEWLTKYGVSADDMLMRPDDNYMRSPELKVWLAKKEFGDDLLAADIGLMIDDREDVVRAFNALGVPTLMTTYSGRTK
jgi:hypothetical protein